MKTDINADALLVWWFTGVVNPVLKLLLPNFLKCDKEQDTGKLSSGG